MHAPAVSQTFLRTETEGSKGILFTDEGTDNKDAVCNGGKAQWPRKAAIAAAAAAIGKQPGDIAGVEVTWRFFTVD